MVDDTPVVGMMDKANYKDSLIMAAAEGQEKLRERIASLERTVGEQADQIGGLTSELEQLREVYTATAELLQIREKQVQQLLKDVSDSQQQLAASQTEAAALRMAAEAFVVWSEDVWHEPWPEEITDFRKALATPSAAAERVQLLEEVAKLTSEYLGAEPVGHTGGWNALVAYRRARARVVDALAALDAATVKEALTVEEVPDAD